MALLTVVLLLLIPCCSAATIGGSVTFDSTGLGASTIPGPGLPELGMTFGTPVDLAPPSATDILGVPTVGEPVAFHSAMHGLNVESVPIQPQPPGGQLGMASADQLPEDHGLLGKLSLPPLLDNMGLSMDAGAIHGMSGSAGMPVIADPVVGMGTSGIAGSLGQPEGSSGRQDSRKGFQNTRGFLETLGPSGTAFVQDPMQEILAGQQPSVGLARSLMPVHTTETPLQVSTSVLGIHEGGLQSDFAADTRNIEAKISSMESQIIAPFDLLQNEFGGSLQPVFDSGMPGPNSTETHAHGLNIGTVPIDMGHSLDFFAPSGRNARDGVSQINTEHAGLIPQDFAPYSSVPAEGLQSNLEIPIIEFGQNFQTFGTNTMLGVQNSGTGPGPSEATVETPNTHAAGRSVYHREMAVGGPTFVGNTVPFDASAVAPASNVAVPDISHHAFGNIPPSSHVPDGFRKNLQSAFGAFPVTYGSSNGGPSYSSFVMPQHLPHPTVMRQAALPSFPVHPALNSQHFPPPGDFMHEPFPTVSAGRPFEGPHLAGALAGDLGVAGRDHLHLHTAPEVFPDTHALPPFGQHHMHQGGSFGNDPGLLGTEPFAPIVHYSAHGTQPVDTAGFSPFSVGRTSAPFSGQMQTLSPNFPESNAGADSKATPDLTTVIEENTNYLSQAVDTFVFGAESSRGVPRSASNGDETAAMSLNPIPTPSDVNRHMSAQNTGPGAEYHAGFPLSPADGTGAFVDIINGNSWDGSGPQNVNGLRGYETQNVEYHIQQQSFPPTSGIQDTQHVSKTGIVPNPVIEYQGLPFRAQDAHNHQIADGTQTDGQVVPHSDLYETHQLNEHGLAGHGSMADPFSSLGPISNPPVNFSDLDSKPSYVIIPVGQGYRYVGLDTLSSFQSGGTDSQNQPGSTLPDSQGLPELVDGRGTSGYFNDLEHLLNTTGQQIKVPSPTIDSSITSSNPDLNGSNAQSPSGSERNQPSTQPGSTFMTSGIDSASSIYGYGSTQDSTMAEQSGGSMAGFDISTASPRGGGTTEFSVFITSPGVTQERPRSDISKPTPSSWKFTSVAPPVHGNADINLTVGPFVPRDQNTPIPNNLQDSGVGSVGSFPLPLRPTSRPVIPYRTPYPHIQYQHPGMTRIPQGSQFPHRPMTQFIPVSSTNVQRATPITYPRWHTNGLVSPQNSLPRGRLPNIPTLPKMNTLNQNSVPPRGSRYIGVGTNVLRPNNPPGRFFPRPNVPPMMNPAQTRFPAIRMIPNGQVRNHASLSHAPRSLSPRQPPQQPREWGNRPGGFSTIQRKRFPLRPGFTGGKPFPPPVRKQNLIDSHRYTPKNLPYPPVYSRFSTNGRVPQSPGAGTRGRVASPHRHPRLKNRPFNGSGRLDSSRRPVRSRASQPPARMRYTRPLQMMMMSEGLGMEI